MNGVFLETSTGTARATMSAVTLCAPLNARPEQVAVPVPGPGEVRIQLEGCGVCASSLPLWEGREWFRYPQPPGAPGHEGWGVVDALGEGVTGLRVGQRVAALSYHAFAEYDLADADAVVPLPASLDGQPFPGEALGCAMNVFARRGVRAGQTVAVVGVGFLGALLVRLATRAGARVIAVSRRPFALDAARAAGAAEALRLKNPGAVMDRVRTLTGAAGCEVVIEASGRQAPLDLASALCGERARLVIAGYHQDGTRQVDMQQWNWKGLDVINAHERDPRIYVQGMKAAIAALEAGDLDPAPLYTHRFSLDETGRAFGMLQARPDGFLKALVLS